MTRFAALWMGLGVVLVAALTPAPTLASSPASSAIEDVELSSSAFDVVQEQKTGREMRRNRRDYRPRIELDRDDILWARSQLKRARVAEVFGLEFMVAGLGSGWIGMVTGVMVPDPNVHLGFSLATTVLLGAGGPFLLLAATQARQIHRRWGTGPLWAGRITGIALWGAAVGFSFMSLGAAFAELAGADSGFVVMQGQAMATILGIPAIIVLAVDLNRHRRPIRKLELVREAREQREGRLRPAVMAVPLVAPVRGGATVGVAGAW